VWAPFSEVFGRRLTIIVSFIPFTAFAASVCGAPTLDAMLVLRFLAGTFGCSSMTNSGATIADMFNAHERGLAMGVFAAMPFLGPVIGPVVGGFLGPATKWEWVAAVAAFFALFITVAQMVFLPETCAVVILRKRAAALTKATGRLHLSEHDIAKPLDVRELMKRQFRVPIKLLFTEPIVFCLSLYMATAFAILYVSGTTIPRVCKVKVF
jgi:MFS family permease